MLIFAALHIDEIANDQTADISEPELACNFIHGLHVGLEDGFFDIPCAFIATGINVDSNKSLGFIDHDVTAALEPDLTMKSVVDLFLDSIFFK